MARIRFQWLFTEAFFAEDKWICERVQRGMHSTMSKGGTLVELEKSVVDFHQYLALKLFGAAAEPLIEGERATMFTL